MTSWRDSASQVAQDDLDALLNLVLPLAEEEISTHGEFYPFGASISVGGDASLTAADSGLGDRPASESLLALLYDWASANAATTRAAAFVADVLAHGAGAVRVELEHSEGVSLVVLRPYTRSRFKKVLTFGELSVAEAQPRIWTGH
jgi:hypothetical protein